MAIERIVEPQPDEPDAVRSYEPDWEDTVAEEEEPDQARPTWCSTNEIYSLFRRVLTEFGWRESPEGVWESPVLVIPIDEGFSIKGWARWPVQYLRQTADTLATARGLTTINPLLQWASLDGHGHPHMTYTRQCHAIEFDGALCRSLTPEQREAFLIAVAATILASPWQIDPRNPLTEWGQCASCRRFRPYLDCATCGSRYCRECMRSHERGCPSEEDEEDEDEEGLVEPAPTTGRIFNAILVGAGVTGSWVYPVLVRHVRHLVKVYDPDTVSPDNPHGLWADYRPGRQKAHTLLGGAHCTVGYAMRYTGRADGADVLVLCPDNAQARLSAVPTDDVGRRVLDIRATPGGLTIWAFKVGEPLEETWRQSLQGYEGRERCGEGEGHDNVPMEAGTLAAAFTAWWLGRGMPEGVWTIPYGFQGMTEREATIYESGD
jgi:hypothetical protein